MARAVRILDVGQCGFDGPRIGRFLAREFKCVVDRANTKAEAIGLAGEHLYDLVLVNRVLNQDRSPGLEVIRELLGAHPGMRVMLVSDFAEAQEEAVKLGAMKGFGKSVLETPETEALLRAVLGGELPLS